MSALIKRQGHVGEATAGRRLRPPPPTTSSRLHIKTHLRKDRAFDIRRMAAGCPASAPASPDT
jgi:hypothetical protein